MTTEAIVTQIFKQVIGVKSLTQESRFLDLGGNSLNLVEVLKQIKERTGVSAPPRMFFDKARSSVAAISAQIDALRNETSTTGNAVAAQPRV